MPKVSIIVPVYNTEDYLEKCLQSLVDLHFKEREIIVIDDGSTDRSPEIINKFQTNYPDEIKSFRKENGGLSDARNFGLDEAKGDYIGFVDSDDYVLPNMYCQLYKLAVLEDAQMVICNLQKVDESGKVTQKLTQIPNLPEGFKLKDHFSVFADLSYFACNKLFKKDLFINERFKKDIHFEDIELIPKLLLKCERIAQTQLYLYNYLERTNSISKTHTEKGLDILNAVESVTKNFKTSVYADYEAELKGFQILQGVYSFLAYGAFVKDATTADLIYAEYCSFINKNNIKLTEILSYKRFGKNYLLSLPLRKIIYYSLYFLGLRKCLRFLT